MVSLNLSPEPNSPGKARAFTRRTLHRWGVPSDTAADTELLVTEIVTNAVIHAGTPLQLELSRDGDHMVRFSVRDYSRDQPVLRWPAPGAVSGRGLQIVNRVASRWWVEDEPDGKVVWVELPPRPLPAPPPPPR